MTSKEMDALSSDPKVLMSVQTSPARNSVNLDAIQNDFEIKVVPDLECDKMEGILLVWQTKEGLLESKLLTDEQGSVPYMSQVKKALTRIKFEMLTLFFLTWSSMLVLKKNLINYPHKSWNFSKMYSNFLAQRKEGSQ
jgi:hypothetical protein